jgi:AcrR family transcriptional regulator
VLDAAREVFAERGVIGGTVEDICERAGFTRGAFYSNFADKDDVLRALIAREHARLLEHVDAGFARLEESLGAGSADDDPATTMAAVADRLLRAVPDDRLYSLIQTELEIHAIREPETSRAFLEADARFRERIAEFLERGLRLLGRELVVDVGEATDAIVAIVERSTRRALLAGRPADPDALARAMLPVLMAAATRPRAQARPAGAGAPAGAGPVPVTRAAPRRT